MDNLTKPKNARGFLFFMLSCVILFISIVCLVINNRNEQIISGATIGEKDTTLEATPDENDDEALLPDTNDATPPETTLTEETTKPQPTAVPAGTIENPTIITIDEANWNLTLVNSGYRIPDSYSPDLVYVVGSSQRLEKRVAEKYEEMYTAAEADGIYLTPCSGYRTYETQERNYKNKIGYYESLGYSSDEAAVKAATIIMPPGSSEHNLGFAMDIVCVDEWFEDTDEFQWLMENAADYGFILRYPKDKQDITRVTYEPWHWRYVGVEAAKEMKQSGEVLEEYLGVS